MIQNVNHVGCFEFSKIKPGQYFIYSGKVYQKISTYVIKDEKGSKQYFSRYKHVNLITLTFSPKQSIEECRRKIRILWSNRRQGIEFSTDEIGL